MTKLQLAVGIADAVRDVTENAERRSVDEIADRLAEEHPEAHSSPGEIAVVLGEEIGCALSC